AFLDAPGVTRDDVVASLGSPLIEHESRTLLYDGKRHRVSGHRCHTSCIEMSNSVARRVPAMGSGLACLSRTMRRASLKARRFGRFARQAFKKRARNGMNTEKGSDDWSALLGAH